MNDISELSGPGDRVTERRQCCLVAETLEPSESNRLTYEYQPLQTPH